MTPWIQVYANLPSHRKVCKLKTALGAKSNYEATGLIVCLWCWAAVNAPDGNLTGYSSQDIAEAIGYKKAPGKLLDVLSMAGFVDRSDNGDISIHDWDEHAALLMDSAEQQKKNTRDRVRRYREKRKGNIEGNKQCNVTCNASNAPTLPNLTLPNLTLNSRTTYPLDDGCESELNESFASFWAAYPKRIGEADALDAWENVATSADVAQQIMSGLEGWKKSEQWRESGGRFIPHAAKFLTEGYWTSPPAVQNGSRELDAYEIEAIRRMMEQGVDE